MQMQYLKVLSLKVTKFIPLLYITINFFSILLMLTLLLLMLTLLLLMLTLLLF